MLKHNVSVLTMIGAALVFAGCGSDAGTWDYQPGADTGGLLDAGGATHDAGSDDAGKDCQFGCNAGESCVDGSCVPDSPADGGGDAGEADGGSPDVAPWDGGQTTITVGTDPKQFVLRGLVVTSDQVLDPGEVYMVNGKLQCVRADCSQFYDYGPNAGKATFIDTQGMITPGIINAHDHMAYNVTPFYEWGKLFQNRYQWQAEGAYRNVVLKPFNDLGAAGLKCEMVKFAEVIHIFAGATTVQGSSYTNACLDGFVRNMDNDYNGFGLHRVVDRVPKIDNLSATDAQKIAGDLQSGAIKAFVVHIGEGIDDASRAELDTLASKGLLLGQTSIIHGTGFRDAQWDKIKAAGARMIWSPKSNISLYGATTDTVGAWKKGIPVSLGPDWSISGSKNILDEVRYAAALNRDKLNNFFTPQDLVRMVTENPAAALSFDDLIGKLAEGYTADVSVFRRRGADAYASFVDLSAEDVDLVFIGGTPLHGRRDWMDAIPRPDLCEPVDICGIPKTLCLKTSDSGSKHNQSLQDILGALKAVYPGLTEMVTCRN